MVIKRWVLGLLILLGPLQETYSSAAPDLKDPYAEINVNWDRFGAVYGRIVENYYKDLDHNEMMRAAIEGMLEELDVYSQYYDEEGLNRLQQDTSGRFAGLGITVGEKGKYPVVISPIENTPASRAGIISGDQIVEIEGKSTFDIGLEEVVRLLRGESGTEVKIKIHRQGGTPDWEISIKRQIIKIESVALIEELKPGIGYISMRQTRFSEETGQDVELALKTLQKKGIEKLILDLRGNPGGLLSQAIQVADLFVAKGVPIVSIKERDGGREETKYSQSKPMLGKLPLIVLVDGGSASAAEIVAGAIQDNDRGIVLGTTSFGKGSVQTIFDLLDTENTALKLTTALYYTPSGRSIHRPYLAAPNKSYLAVPVGSREVSALELMDIILNTATEEEALVQIQTRLELEEDQAIQALSTTFRDLIGKSPATDKKEPDVGNNLTENDNFYRTQQGRKVFGGGGIKPDIEIKQNYPPGIVLAWERQRLFFDFAVEWIGADSLVAQASTVPVVDEATIETFIEYLSKQKIKDKLEGEGQRRIEELSTLVGEMGWSANVTKAIDHLQTTIKAESTNRIFDEKIKEYIRFYLKRNLILRLHGRKASLLLGTERDNQVQSASELLKNLDEYNKVLNRKTS